MKPSINPGSARLKVMSARTGRVQRHAATKFKFTEPVWKYRTGRSSPAPRWLRIIVFTLLLIDSSRLQNRGRSFLALVAYAAAPPRCGHLRLHEPVSHITSIIVGILLITGMIGVIAVLLAEAHEWAEALWCVIIAASSNRRCTERAIAAGVGACAGL